MFYSAIRSMLFLSDPETAHELVTTFMSSAVRIPGAAMALQTAFRYRSSRLECSVCGLKFENPVGMAAGFDKTAELYPFLALMGFGFVESGTFTALAQDGNPKPRMFRFPEHQALVNRMGFNNPGAEAVATVLARQMRTIVRGINIGKSKAVSVEEAEADYLKSLALLLPQADYIAVNVSSPNTPGLRLLQEASRIHSLIGVLRSFIDEHRRVPLFVKLAPDLKDDELRASIEAIVAARADGLILTNTSLDKSAIPAAVNVEGGLSGAPLRKRSTEIIRRAFQLTEGRLPIIGVGGIFSGEDAFEKIRAGASLVQVYTGYIYQGPGLPSKICRYLDRMIEKSGKTLDQLVGLDAS
jgi:dihydroorotate dehydrogenase